MTIKEIQAALMTAVETLQVTTKTLGLVHLLTELERNYPEDMDSEQVSEGDVCPPLAWSMHADVGNAKILLEEVIGSLEKASRCTERDVRTEWIGEKLSEIKDPSTQSLFSFFLGLYLESEVE